MPDEETEGVGWSGTGEPTDAHRPNADVEITFDADTDRSVPPPMTAGLRAVCVLVWTAAALLGAYGIVRLIAGGIGLLAGASIGGVLGETVAVGVGQLAVFVVSIAGVYWTIERRARGAVALSASLFALAGVGVLAVGVPFGAAPISGVVPTARNADRGFYERF